MSREEAASEYATRRAAAAYAIRDTLATRNGWDMADAALAAADAHDAAHGIHRTKTMRLPDEVGQWYASVTSGMIVESVMGMMTGERSEWFYVQNGPWIKIDLDGALEERMLDDATVERAAVALYVHNNPVGNWSAHSARVKTPYRDAVRAVLAAAVEAGQ